MSTEAEQPMDCGVKPFNLARVFADPGCVVPRYADEALWRWQTRALRTAGYVIARPEDVVLTPEQVEQVRALWARFEAEPCVDPDCDNVICQGFRALPPQLHPGSSE